MLSDAIVVHGCTAEERGFLTACTLTLSDDGTDIRSIGEDPNIDYAKLAQSMGWYAEGPITDPKELGPAIRRAVAVVENGEPACWML